MYKHNEMNEHNEAQGQENKKFTINNFSYFKFGRLVG